MDYIVSLADKHPNWLRLAGLFLAGVLWQGLPAWRGLASRRWPSVPGWVHASTFGPEDVFTGSAPSIQFTAFVEYTYRIGEKEFRGRRRRFGLQPSAIDPQPRQGEWVTIWYNPRWPREATLETGIRAETWFALVVCFLGAAGSLAMAARP
jgi:hypothetical protein